VVLPRKKHGGGGGKMTSVGPRGKIFLYLTNKSIKISINNLGSRAEPQLLEANEDLGAQCFGSFYSFF